MTSVSGSESQYDQLTVRVFPTTRDMAGAAAEDVAQVLRAATSHGRIANAMFATGNSQLAMLASLTAMSDIAWERVQVFHMDEYVGLDETHPASFRRYIHTHLADIVHPMETHYVGGTVDAAPTYAALLRDHPLDLCVMGIGENGHLAFNDPPVADFEDPLDVKVVELDAACRQQQVGEGHFASMDDVPTYAVTVTIPALLRAKNVIVVCPDARKATPVAAALRGPISTACPASALRRCPQARLYLDQAAAALI
jgi:glucosamine-6-phosphate deaminase